jgi:phosphatidylinositol glycan class O
MGTTTAKTTRRGTSRRSKSKLVDLVVPILAIGGLYWFSASFFLAKRSLPHVSVCDEAPSLLQDILGLTTDEANAVAESHHNLHGCWLDRRVDSLVILVVDALRFDFARYELPLSVGSRISKLANRTTASQLLQFVADPPTVTMQRLKGLTTGSLPTFADISGNMGGANIDEDSWVQQLKTAPYDKRGLKFPSRLGFVGDDTWVDLFPTQFDESHPLPSFNTRDLDSVDNGCLAELPGLLKLLRTAGDKPDELEVIVSHFLGVDHVGHTYGPHDKHMDKKLRQIDAALSTTLEVLDESKHCHLALIFGDHGMTEDGNHGGGTDNEINAALFVHFSPACGAMPLDLTPQMGTTHIQEAFQSIHQIDLVPTISILLGLPIPYANLGGIVPSLLGYEGVKETAAALALNAAQVWRYFTVYSETANKLPNLPELQEQLAEAITVYKEALAQKDADDSNAFYKACGLFKLFLVEATELGHRVWTRFDTVGMILGGAIVFLTLVVWIFSLFFEAGPIRLPPRNQFVEMGVSSVFVFFQSGMLSFSNSYIEAEQAIVMFMMGVIGAAIFARMSGVTAGGNAKIIPFIPLLVPLLSRIGESFVSGHGQDPSIRLHPAHSSVIFLPSLVCLLALRVQCYRAFAYKVKNGLFHAAVDGLSVGFLAIGWMDKRSLDQSQNGYFWMRVTIAILILCTPSTIYEGIAPLIMKPKQKGAEDSGPYSTPREVVLARALAVVAKLLIGVMVVTGPATGATVLLVSLQGWMLYLFSGATGFYEVRLGSEDDLRIVICKLILTDKIFFMARSRYPRLSKLFCGDWWFDTSFLLRIMGVPSIDFNIRQLLWLPWNLTLPWEAFNYSSILLPGKY